MKTTGKWYSIPSAESLMNDRSGVAQTALRLLEIFRGRWYHLLRCVYTSIAYQGKCPTPVASMMQSVYPTYFFSGNPLQCLRPPLRGKSLYQQTGFVRDRQ